MLIQLPRKLTYFCVLISYIVNPSLFNLQYLLKERMFKQVLRVSHLLNRTQLRIERKSADQEERIQKNWI